MSRLQATSWAFLDKPEEFGDDARGPALQIASDAGVFWDPSRQHVKPVDGVFTMSLRNFFKPVRMWTTDETKRFIREANLLDYQLVDVRQPEEYEAGHLPGAVLIPLGDLRERIADLDREKTTIVYCRAGRRSASGAAILDRAGFGEVVSLGGGMDAWDGVTAKGSPTSAMVYFAEAVNAEEFIALSWLLEKGANRFYEAISRSLEDPGEKTMFGEFAADEARHMQSLTDLYRTISGRESSDGFPECCLADESPQDVMEGHMHLSDALGWALEKDTRDILEMTLGMEADAHDLYLKMARELGSEDAGVVFDLLARDEKTHLERMADRLRELV